MGQSSSKQTTETTWDDTENEEFLSLLLMGKTGHGKSSLGNSILGCETFKISDYTDSQTAEVVCAYSEFESFSLKVVDGPGLMDTQLSKLKDSERAVRNMNIALTMCCGGIDAFLFVFSFGVRFTSEEVSVLETLKAIFGKDYFKHAIVVLTQGDQFEMKDITFDDWCKKQTGSFRELYEACDRRCVLFNNNESDKDKQMTQREQLTQLVQHLKRRHGRYTADCFKLAASERQRMIIKLKQPLFHVSFTQNDKELMTLLLMGRTGHGQSSLGNSILGREAFKVSNQSITQTAEIECAYSDFECFTLKVVDGPGLHDIQLNKLKDTERAVRNMNIALTMCCEGVDAFLFVCRFDVRFTSEDVSVLETIKAIFGKDYFKHAIVVLTHGYRFKMIDITFGDWCKKQTGPFRELYKACDGRCVLFNNNTYEMEKEEQRAQREQLTQLVQKLKRRHGRYTAECFKRATSERQRMIMTLKHPKLKEEIQTQAGILVSKIENYYKQPCSQQRAEIEGSIRKLKNEIKTEDKGHGLLKDLMEIVEDVERNLHDVVKVHRLTERLENAKKAAQI